MRAVGSATLCFLSSVQEITAEVILPIARDTYRRTRDVMERRRFVIQHCLFQACNRSYPRSESPHASRPAHPRPK
ncbi:hypothetical protein GQ44DRAFT_701342 [Phaeosphaeriaceae sp. PMI808]|nr:hypothetical protein GQ44DRAFT_701342 [Phaeosphaeriaceae sp. PMI808]